MEKSATIGELAKALAQFQGEVEGVKKDGFNPGFRFKYATLESVVDTIKKPLSKAGLSYTQFPGGTNELHTILMHSSGEFIQSTVTMTPKDLSPQSVGSAITYMRRYALSSILGLATEDDDDGNAAQGKKIETKTVTKEVVSPLKTEIKNLCDSINPLLEKGQYESFVQVETGLLLVEHNYPAIVAKLKAKVAETNREKDKMLEEMGSASDVS